MVVVDSGGGGCGGVCVNTKRKKGHKACMGECGRGKRC